MKGDEFHILLDRLKASDAETWSGIRSHIEIILNSWAKREKIELDWVRSYEGIGNPGSVVEEVYSRFREGLLSGILKTNNYSEYKKAVFQFAGEILKDQYVRFNEIIREGNNKAWKKVHDRLYIYAAKWLSERKIEGETASDIYQDSILTLYHKVREEELHFETSREFKSYYFRILEFKFMEGSRKKISNRQKWPETEAGRLFRSLQEEAYETDDRYYIIKEIMSNSISREEEYILKQYYFHGEKLTEIASALQISDGNCRQKKLQALRKIAAIYHQTELKKQGPQ